MNGPFVKPASPKAESLLSIEACVVYAGIRFGNLNFGRGGPYVAS